MSGNKAAKIGNGAASFADAIAYGSVQIIAITSGGSAMLSAAVGASTSLIRIASNVGCYVAVGSSPVATASTATYHPAGHVEKVVVNPGDKVSIKDAAATGIFSITEATSA